MLERDLYSDGLPQLASEKGLMMILSTAQIRQVVVNARRQKPDVQPGELVAALAHYYVNDSFVVLGNNDVGTRRD
ncbi:hypothetical protein JGU66_03785 [Myxococcaceae bacterium JPH2]|nr:hypothetical protein [Myxococcaceae bacterium JPH2]